MPPTPTIRPAVPDDAPAIVALVRALAAYEGLSSACEVTEAQMRAHGFGADARFECLLAETAGTPVGLALFYPTFSTFMGRPGLFVEDIFVVEQARGQGLGRALMARLAALAIERDMAYLDLNVLDWNPARQFYRALGFAHLAAWQPMRLDGPGLDRLARRR